MNEIQLNDILGLTTEEIKKSKIELNMKAGPEGETYLERWLSSDSNDKNNGICSECGYWGWFGKSQNFQPQQWVFNFVRLTGDEWLFISAGKIVEVPKNACAEVTIFDKYKPYFGRLIIKLKKGNTFARYTFNLSTFLNKCTVLKILPSLYDGEGFPGYNNVNLSLKQLKSIFNRGKEDWISALENQKAVYLITDKNNGKMYVGSATSDKGMLLQRWRSYIVNGHGDNKELKAIVNNKGFDYIKTNFYYSILENYNLKVDDHIILTRETWWKTILQTKQFGYNDN